MKAPYFKKRSRCNPRMNRFIFKPFGWSHVFVQNFSDPVFSLLLAGCSRNVVTYSLEGTVSAEGKPIQTGMLFFIPNDPGKQARPAEFTVVDGKFSVKPPYGVAPGKYKISVLGYDPRFPDGYAFDHVFEPGQKSYTLDIKIENQSPSKKR